MLETFFTSKVRVKILELFFLSRSDKLHVRDITRQIDEEINAVRRELSRLYKVKLLGREKRGNRLYYFLKEDFPLYPELYKMIIKEFGLGGEIRRRKKELGDLKYAGVAFEFFTNRVGVHEELDLFLVGKINMNILDKIISKFEREIGKEIHYSDVSENDFYNMKSVRNPFIKRFTNQDIVVLIGDRRKFLEY